MTYRTAGPRARRFRYIEPMPLLEIRDLRKSYRAPDGEEFLVLDVPRFEVAAREQVGLQGSSGSGKTTLLNLVAGIQRADSGAIRLDGQDLVALSEPERDRLRAEKIGYVFQTFDLLQGYSALENVLLGMMFGPGPDPRAGARPPRGAGPRQAPRPSPPPALGRTAAEGRAGPRPGQPPSPGPRRRADRQSRRGPRSGGHRGDPTNVPRARRRTPPRQPRRRRCCGTSSARPRSRP